MTALYSTTPTKGAIPYSFLAYCPELYASTKSWLGSYILILNELEEETNKQTNKQTNKTKNKAELV